MMVLSPNIKPHNKPHTPQSYVRFPWEKPTKEEVEAMAARCKVSDEEAAALNRIFDDLNKRNNREQDR